MASVANVLHELQVRRLGLRDTFRLLARTIGCAFATGILHLLQFLRATSDLLISRLFWNVELFLNGLVYRFFSASPRESKVTEASEAVLVDKDVCWFEVPVHNIS